MSYITCHLEQYLLLKAGSLLIKKKYFVFMQYKYESYSIVDNQTLCYRLFVINCTTIPSISTSWLTKQGYEYSTIIGDKWNREATSSVLGVGFKLNPQPSTSGGKRSGFFCCFTNFISGKRRGFTCSHKNNKNYNVQWNYMTLQLS